VGASNWFAVKLQYHITPFDASFFDRAAGNQIQKKRSLVSAQTKFGFKLRRNILNYHAEPGASHFAFPELEQQFFWLCESAMRIRFRYCRHFGKN
jgi:hypothetical protein